MGITQIRHQLFFAHALCYIAAEANFLIGQANLSSSYSASIHNDIVVDYFKEVANKLEDKQLHSLLESEDNFSNNVFKLIKT